MQFEAKIASVFPKKFLSLEAFSVLKNWFKVGTPSLIALSATFFEGSIPRMLSLFSKKFFNNVPSFEPISIILEWPFKIFFLRSLKIFWNDFSCIQNFQYKMDIGH